MTYSWRATGNPMCLGALEAYLSDRHTGCDSKSPALSTGARRPPFANLTFHLRGNHERIRCNERTASDWQSVADPEVQVRDTSEKQCEDGPYSSLLSCSRIESGS